MRIVALDKESKQSILNDLLKRSPNNYSQYESTVNQIIEKSVPRVTRHCSIIPYSLISSL